MGTDLELLERWRGGDEGAGQQLFSRHFAEIFRFFSGKVTQAAEDLAQQTFLECVRSRDQFRGESSFRTYLFGIAWNELRQHLRRGVKDGRVDFEVSSLDELAASRTSPSSQLDRADRASRVRQALARLSVAEQVLLEYHYWHDLDAPALGVIFGISAGAVRVRLLRARASLRGWLAQLKAERPAAGERDPRATSF